MLDLSRLGRLMFSLARLSRSSWVLRDPVSKSSFGRHLEIKAMHRWMAITNGWNHSPVIGRVVGWASAQLSPQSAAAGWWACCWRCCCCCYYQSGGNVNCFAPEVPELWAGAVAVAAVWPPPPEPRAADLARSTVPRHPPPAAA